MSMSLSSRFNRSRRPANQSPAAGPAAPERLQSRIMMHGPGFEANINLQKATPPAPTAYVIDAGQIFGDRGNGLTYGWDADNAASARDRNKSRSPDQRYATLTRMQLYRS